MEINDEIIEKAEKIKSVGIIIDNCMNFKDHIDYICNNIAEINLFL